MSTLLQQLTRECDREIELLARKPRDQFFEEVFGMDDVVMAAALPVEKDGQETIERTAGC